MYKVIHNGIVIDLLRSVRYGKYIPATKRVVATDKSNANCIVASNLKDRYLLKGVPVPEGCSYPRVSVVPITNEEYYSLIDRDSNAFQPGIKRLRKSKIDELRSICNYNILEGVQVELTDGKLHHFTMTLEDQLNLLEIRYLIDSGKESFIYHETDGECREFSSEDMKKIIDATFKHKQHHLLYFNMMKKHINQLTNIDDISRITYGMKL